MSAVSDKNSFVDPNGIQTSDFPKYLDWKNRPEEMRKKITEAFKQVKNDSSPWGLFNGAERYFMCGIDEQGLVKKIICDATQQKEFFILDIGAGNFSWGDALARFIETQVDFPQVKVHIISVIGERYSGEQAIETDRCKIYRLGAFKVEELFEEFKKYGFNLEGKIDLAISRWCFRHLVDPVGTFVQLYNLLRPETGFFLTDGFAFYLEDDDDFLLVRMIQLFLDSKAPFLYRIWSDARDINQFILQRPNDTICQLPMQYIQAERTEQMNSIQSRCITRFRREPQETDKDQFYRSDSQYEMCSEDILHGSKKLYDYLLQSGVLTKNWPKSRRDWLPIYQKDAYQK